MNTPVSQDTNSAAAGTPGEVVTPGEPVQHRDISDGQSVGQYAEPEHSESSRGNGAPPKASDMPAAEPPPKTSLEEIYGKAKTGRNAEISDDLAEMTPAQRIEYARMVAEAGGGPDPYAQEGEPPDTGNQAPTIQTTPKTLQQQGPSAPNNLPAGIDPAAEMTTITVYGMREQVPTAQVNAAGGLTAYQKARAADIRLQRVATYEASLRNWESQLSERAANLEQGRQPPAQGATGTTGPSDTDAPGGTADVNALSRLVTEAFYSGDREEAELKLASAFTSIQTEAIRAARASVPAVQPSGQSGAAAQAAETARREANAVFLNEFRDLDTPVLREAALSMVQAVAKDPVMIGRPLAEVTREACERIREDVYGSREAPPGYESTPQLPVANKAPVPLHKQPPKPPQQDLGQRFAMKRRTVVSPLNEAHGRTPPPPDANAAFPSNKEFVSNLRKGRGQPG